jgi:hypothetical protein
MTSYWSKKSFLIGIDGMHSATLKAMQFILLLIVQILLGVQTNPIYAAPPPRDERQEVRDFKPIEIIEDVPVPQYLWHWTHWNVLAQIKSSDTLVIPKMKFHNIFFGKTRGKFSKGLFTWINPISGMGFRQRELYFGWEGAGAPVRIEMDVQKARAIRIITRDSPFTMHWKIVEVGKKAEKILDNYKNFDSVDVIEHWNVGQDRDRREVLYFREWIIRKSRHVKSFTTDPDVIKPILQAEIEKIRTNGFSLPEEKNHTQTYILGYGDRSNEEWLKYLTNLGEHIYDTIPPSCVSALADIE